MEAHDSTVSAMAHKLVFQPDTTDDDGWEEVIEGVVGRSGMRKPVEVASVVLPALQSVTLVSEASWIPHNLEAQ